MKVLYDFCRRFPRHLRHSKFTKLPNLCGGIKGGSMKKTFVFLLFLAVLGTNFTLFADDDDEKLKLAVMEFEDKSGKLSAETLSNATEYIRGAFVASNKFIVIAKERQENAMIKQMKKESYKACNDKNCQIPLGQALSADTILRTTITFFAKKYTITSELIDLAKEATTKGAKATFDGSEESLNEALDDIVSQIIGRKNKRSEFQQGRFGEESDDWEIGGGEETIVKFESSPAGAVVMADGKLLCQSTPCSKMLTTGSHQIEMQKENYVAVSQKQEIKDGKTVKFTLDPDFAWLTVTGNYTVSLRLDGQNIGELPINEKVINPGNHKVEHTDGCFYSSGETFTVKRGEKKNIRFDLKHRESAIKVYAQDEKGNDIDADVFVDDKKVGRAPGTFKVPLCSKKLLIKNGEIEYSEELSLKEKQVKTLQAQLKRKSLQWSNKTPNRMNWNDAINYCKNLNEGGHSDWRLPNIDELRTLIQNHSGTQTSGSCPISEKAGKLDGGDWTNDCTGRSGSNFSKLGDAYWFWSSSTLSDYTNFAWLVYFNDGRVGSNNKYYNYNVRCVR